MYDVLIVKGTLCDFLHERSDDIRFNNVTMEEYEFLRNMATRHGYITILMPLCECEDGGASD